MEYYFDLYQMKTFGFTLNKLEYPPYITHDILDNK